MKKQKVQFIAILIVLAVLIAATFGMKWYNKNKEEEKTAEEEASTIYISKVDVDTITAFSYEVDHVTYTFTKDGDTWTYDGDTSLDMDEEAVAEGIEKIHTEYVSNIQYNNENSLSSVLAIAYLSSMEYYFKPVRELPTGRGFADFVFIPKPEYISDYPALVVELKWNKNAETALQQIKEKKYPESIKQYTGDILLVGINYDKKTKKHQCLVESYEKQEG